ncbi:hypothetical protein E2C01_029541 [Portunus trituberculatus]|uniref:Tudor domain-containing protein n=1 Tax=Portunus trituberculatus TaxID=210409 RepID=A0A5B7ERQ7_PORTR|nr:hypothetical protein [Portunus trituberculatus]
MESEASCSTFAPSLGDKCVVIRRNRQYARARILSVREEQAEVLLLDCGGIEEASVANLCQLPEGKFSTTDPFYQVVNLAGVLPPGGLKVWPGVTLDYLRNHFSSYKKFFIVPEGEPTWDEKLQMKVQPVDLGWMHEKMGGPMEPNKITWVSTNKELISCGLGLPVRLSSPLKKATIENDKKFHLDLVCSSDCKKGEEDSLSTEKSEV